MKKIIFVTSIFAALLLTTSCKKDGPATMDVLIDEIANSSDKVNIDPQDIPETTKTYTDEAFFETYIESVAYVDGKGYEINLGNEDVFYCDNRGIAIHANGRQHGPHRQGRCGGGTPLTIDELPADITNYVADNYPDAEIKRAKLKGDYYLVAITGRVILVFDANGAFLNEFPLFRFCIGERIAIDDLPTAIVDYITANYPDAEIKVAGKIRGKIVVGILTDEGRKILVFDLDGNFLFERP